MVDVEKFLSKTCEFIIRFTLSVYMPMEAPPLPKWTPQIGEIMLKNRHKLGSTASHSGKFVKIYEYDLIFMKKTLIWALDPLNWCLGYRMILIWKKKV